MTVRVVDLDLKTVFVEPDFTVRCPEYKLKAYKPSEVAPPSYSGPLNIPSNKNQCVHVEEIFDKTGKLIKHDRCLNLVGKAGRSGWLCGYHLLQQTKKLQVIEQKPTIKAPFVQIDCEDLIPAMMVEVADTRLNNYHNVAIDWWLYHHRGWSENNSNPFINHEEFEEVEDWDGFEG